MSTKDSLSQGDLKKWAVDTLIYCIAPALLVFMDTFKTHDFAMAWGAAELAFLAAAANLLGKYKAGVEVELGAEVEELKQLPATLEPAK